tara:strand:- start:3705 stop:4496 length:792 start_codon:yes stop_codon:yes gene_type:complete
VKIVKNKLEAINYMIAKSGLKYSDIAREANISRPQIHRWINNEVADVRFDSVYAISDALGYDIKHHNNNIEIINKKKGGNGMDLLIKSQQRTIELQDEKINRLESKNKELQESSINNPFKNQLWDQIMPHMSSTVYVKNVISYENMDRKIVDTIGAELFQKHLDLPDDIVKKCFNDTSWHKSKDHPIDTLVEKESLMDLQQISTYLVGLFNTMKWLTGITEYLDFPIKYRYINKTLKTQCAVKIKLEKPIKIFTKSVILTEVN